MQEDFKKAEESNKEISERLKGREDELISQLAHVQEELQKERQEHNRVVEEKENQLLSVVEKAKLVRICQSPECEAQKTRFSNANGPFIAISCGNEQVEVELKEAKKRTDLEQKAGEEHIAKMAGLEREIEEAKAERGKVEDALLKAEETYKLNVAELNNTIEKKTVEARESNQSLQAMVRCL